MGIKIKNSGQNERPLTTQDLDQDEIGILCDKHFTTRMGQLVMKTRSGFVLLADGETFPGWQEFIDRNVAP